MHKGGSNSIYTDMLNTICKAAMGFCMLSLYFASMATLYPENSTKVGEKSLNHSIMAYVKLPPMRELSEKLTAKLRAVQPGLTTEIMLMQLKPYGFPAFEGVSATDGMVIFAIYDENEQMPLIVMLAKATPESAFLQAISKEGKYQFRREGDWVLLAEKKRTLNVITDIKPLLKINSDKTEHDIWGSIFTDVIKSRLLEVKLLTLLQMGVPLGGTPTDDLKDSLILFDVLAGRLVNLERFEFFANFQSESTNIGIALKAQAGSPEADLFNSKSGFNVPSAKYISNEFPLVMVGSFDAKAYLKYFDFIFSEVSSMANSDQHKPLELYRTIIRDSLTFVDGTYAATVDFKGGKSKMASVSGTKLSYDDLLRICRDSYEGENSLMLRMTQIIANKNTSYSFSLKPVAFEHAGIKVISTRSKMEEREPVMVADNEDWDGISEPQKPSEPQPVIFSDEHEDYMAVVDGVYVIASNPDEIKAIIDRIKDKKLVAAEIIKLTAENAMQVRLNLPQYLISNVDLDSVKMNEESMQAMHEIIKNSIPLIAKVINSNDRLEGSVDIPTKTLVDVMSLMTGLSSANHKNELTNSASSNLKQPLPQAEL